MCVIQNHSVLSRNFRRASGVQIKLPFAEKVQFYRFERKTLYLHKSYVSKLDFASISKNHLGQALGKKFEPEQPDYDRWFNDTYLIRNKIVHSGYVPSQRESVDAVLAVEYALEYLDGRPKERSWLKDKPMTVINEFFTDTR